MEYVSKINIFCQKMMVKSGLEKHILKFLHAQNYFFYFIKMPKIANSVKEMSFFGHGGISTKLFVMHVHIINETLSHKFHLCSILSMRTTYESLAYYVLSGSSTKYGSI